MEPDGSGLCQTRWSREQQCPPPSLAEGCARPVRWPATGPTSWPWPRPAPARPPSPSPRPAHVLADTAGARLVVVAPTAHLKVQWAAGGRRASRCTSTRLVGRRRSASRPTCTASSPPTSRWRASAAVLRRLADGAFVVFDEIHHAGDERAWGDGVRLAFEPARAPAGLSGTPFRSDTRAIPFVRYDARRGRRRTTSTATARRWPTAASCGPSTSPASTATWSGRRPTASLNAASFDDALDDARAEPAAAHRAVARRRVAAHGAARRPSTASTAIRRVAARRRRPRHRHRPGPRPRHRRPPARPVRRRGHGGHLRRPDGVGAASPTSPRGRQPWLVAVRMVSEGVDIPRLRVGVYATTTTTELFFRQAVGRFVRWTPGRAGPEGVPVHPRRSAAAGPGLPDRRPAPPQPPQAGRDPSRAGPRRARRRSRRAAVPVPGALCGGHRSRGPRRARSRRRRRRPPRRRRPGPGARPRPAAAARRRPDRRPISASSSAGPRAAPGERRSAGCGTRTPTSWLPWSAAPDARTPRSTAS